MPNPAHPTKVERREAARERARAATAAQKKREARNKLLVRSGILVGIVAFVAVVALVIVTGIKPAGPGSRNMASDGIVIGKGFVAERTAALAAGQEPTPTKTPLTDKVAHIRLYGDFLCPNCGAFERQNGSYIKGLVKSGGATIEYHPVAILDRASMGTDYSTRAANAAAAVANYSPDSYFAFNEALFAAQPAENSEGLSDARLKSVAGDVTGIDNLKSIEKAIDNREFAGWVADATSRAGDNAMQGSDLKKFVGTPTVIVNGKAWDGTKLTFTEFVTAAISDTTKN
ncbi:MULTISPECIES: thioredoxin domain-containing protein [unclassified Frondihabitans]|uniref:DsbA family protein n=1 Tax=unclassified Frondihabitans TaxID=2626248 RepID=UPI000F4E8FA6|nr:MULTISPECIES: thioredoxin domain-containing protein [unclassified Frondihabitans]RPE78171.1 thioredoxin-like protein [Frondihabitans sp. PhB153]RPF08452.1 thioredoxin-like protein [Frondihabitans sp. PhB161]